jgi:hypothetical protein
MTEFHWKYFHFSLQHQKKLLIQEPLKLLFQENLKSTNCIHIAVSRFRWSKFVVAEQKYQLYSICKNKLNNCILQSLCQ